MPAEDGVKVIPDIPGPENVPPRGFPISVEAGSLKSYWGLRPVNVTTGLS